MKTSLKDGWLSVPVPVRDLFYAVFGMATLALACYLSPSLAGLAGWVIVAWGYGCLVTWLGDCLRYFAEPKMLDETFGIPRATQYA